MDTVLDSSSSQRITVPVIALTFYAIASGYLMSLVPLMLPHYQLDMGLASWIASAFYSGLLLGAMLIEPVVVRLGHRNSFIAFLLILLVSIVTLPLIPTSIIWIVARFVAGIAVAGIFVVVESWLLHGTQSGRAKRLGVYMAALYGGSSLGQLGIGYLGTSGLLPFATISCLILAASLVLLFTKPYQPNIEQTSTLSLRQISKLNHAALLGCMVSGLTLGAIYGLMPVELTQRGLNSSDIGSLLALIILGGMIVQPAIPWLSKFFGRTLLMALFCLIGSVSVVLPILDATINVLAISLFMLGMATFAIYPIAINLGCDKLSANYIVSATQVMLFSYSLGSVAGPVIADIFMQNSHGLLNYLLVIQLATCLYMLLVSVKTKRQLVAGE